MDGGIIVAQARTWIGTPFHHQGRLKEVGCDCLGMLIGVAKELHLTHNGMPLAALDNTNYSETPNVHELVTKMQDNLTQVDNEDMQIGDVALMNIQDNPQHLGIITDYVHGGFGLLHALAGNGVVEHALTAGWKRRIYRLYRFEVS